MTNIPFHEHTFVIPTATTEEIAAGLISDKAITPDQLLPVLESLEFSEAMPKLIYDPNNVAADVFDMDNMVEGATNLILTAAERALIASAVQAGDALVSADIGTTVQAWDAQLDSLASASANGVSLVTAADYAAMRALLDLEAGTDFYSITAADAAFQPKDSDLTAIAALTTTSFGRSFLDRADAAAGRSLLGLGTAATQNTGTSGGNVPLLNGVNTWSGVQSYQSAIWQGGISATAQGTNTSGFASSVAGSSVVLENTSASGSGGGGGFIAYCNDGAAMASGDRLGLNLFGGSSSASAIRNTAGIAAYSSQAWVDGSAYGTRLEFQTTANSGTTRSTKLILGNSGILTFGATEASSVPALKPSSAVLQARLGDDSDFAIVSVKSLSVSDAPTTRSNLGLAFGTNIREVLTADRTYYVRTDGSDSNNGLANTSGGAWLTLQKAMDVVAATLDFGGYTVTIQIGDGTYTAGLTIKACVGMAGPGSLIFQGNSGATSNVVISTTSAGCVLASGGVMATLQYLKLQTTTAGTAITCSYGAQLNLTKINFGACANYGILCFGGGRVLVNAGNFTISGAMGSGFIYCAISGLIGMESVGTITISGTPNLTVFAALDTLGNLRINGNTFSGSATGSRYSVSSGAVIFTNGAGTTYLPGNSAGTGTNFGASPYGLYQ